MKHETWNTEHGTSVNTDKVLHRAIKKIGEDISNLHYNTAVSELMKLLNEFENLQPTTYNLQAFLKLLAPFAPHLAEEIWVDVLKNKKSIHLEAWPDYDEKLLVDTTLRIPVQINGKVRDTIEIPADSGEAEVRAAATAGPKVKEYLAGKEIKKFIYIPGKMVSIVI